MIKKTWIVIVSLMISFTLWSVAPAEAILIDNGIAGDGRWQINVLNGGETRTGSLDPTGGIGLTDVIFDYFHYVDVGADGGGVRLGGTTITSPASLGGGGSVTSSGTFLGANGLISWRTDSSIAPGSSLYLTEFLFSSPFSFGNVRLIQYLDEDVLGFTDDHLIVLGTPGTDGFQLLTVDDSDNVGVSHAATYSSAVGMSYTGWAADEFSDLRSDITGPGALYSIAGIVDTTSLPVIVGGDGRYPGSPAYGPEDITSAIAFDFDPNATYASVIFSLGGSPSGIPPPPPGGGSNVIPEPASMMLLGSGLLGMIGFRRKQRS